MAIATFLYTDARVVTMHKWKAIMTGWANFASKILGIIGSKEQNAGVIGAK